MTAPIIAHYEQIALSREFECHRLVEHPILREREPGLIAASAAQMRQLIESKRFFRDHDYGWAAEPNSYGSILEAELQRYVLTAISEIQRDHPHYALLGNICVRASAIGGVNAHSFVSGSYKYAVVVPGLLKFLWEFVHTFDEVLPRRGRYSEVPGADRSAARWTVARVHRCLRHKGKAVDRLIRIAAIYADFCVPGGLHPKYPTSECLGSRRRAYMSQVVAAADAFIVFHEIGHLLSHGAFEGKRDIGHEIEADRSAVSLLTRLGANDPLIARMFFSGPALAFTTMISFCLVGRVYRYLESTSEGGTPFDRDAELRYASELQTRSMMYFRLVEQAGFPASFVAAYHVVRREMEFAVKLIEERILQRVSHRRLAIFRVG